MLHELFITHCTNQNYVSKSGTSKLYFQRHNKLTYYPKLLCSLLTDCLLLQK